MDPTRAVRTIVSVLFTFALCNAVPPSQPSVLSKSAAGTQPSSRSQAQSAQTTLDQLEFHAFVSNAVFRNTRVSSRAGLTGEGCESDDDCIEPRACYSEGDQACTSVVCFCAPETLEQCDQSFECVLGEVCGQLEGSNGNPFCISEPVVKGNPNITEVEPTGNGLTWDECRTSLDCAGVRLCELFVEGEIVECKGDLEGCHCFEEVIQTCTICEECENPGELCADKTNFDPVTTICVSKNAEEMLSFLTSVCSSESPVPTPTSTDEPVPSSAAGESPSPSPETTSPVSSPTASPISSPFTTGGLTWDPCRTTSDCMGDRKCEIMVDDEVVECDNDQEGKCHCFFALLQTCTINVDCGEPGEICAELQTTDTGDSQAYCVSKEAEQTVSILTEVSPSPSPVPLSPPPVNTPSSDSSGSACFPARAAVELEDGSVVAMRELSVGDRIHVGKGVFSPVFAFSHADANVITKFVTITTEAGRKLTVTSGHYVYTNEGAIAAGEVRVGDRMVLAEGGETVVSAVSEGVDSGLYNPQTLQGDIAVDGILACTYTTAVEPKVAEALLAPVRAFFRGTGADGLFGWLDSGAPLMANVMPKGDNVV